MDDVIYEIQHVPLVLVPPNRGETDRGPHHRLIVHGARYLSRMVGTPVDFPIAIHLNLAAIRNDEDAICRS